MAGEEAFKKNYQRYDKWFEDNPSLYETELEALKRFVPKSGKGFESGVGTGKFALPLNIEFGIDPVKEMFEEAIKNGIKTVCAKGENLPFKDNCFDFGLAVTTICFYDDILLSFKEAKRVIKKGGCLVLGFVDNGSWMGKVYREKKHKNPFYKDAVFYTVDEVKELLETAGFEKIEIIQAIFEDNLKKIAQGYGKGGFAVIKGVKGR
ncbi:MAG: class I SAM-dependent methyltransferase [Desulforegulaceae bacterium]|nr:class I SAM-dependent methyltransferase [Desulforegulaceae bacterium]